ncbi:hypothetical protein A176_001703 [Myxococcus hansupus]|uniref:Tat (Twin-arginine translocation) pathway signal sequence domain protein n=1 Tax=Pseudomyxococcus hansupus TaxID=1297742 RepID=A0A0H4WMY8_9BACT|nr:DUF1501 domain-containing protein [Myxococcus hansupus]AKQ64791.1 hypothetical protein A176_001703 [Myxococcus hansupus]
MSFSRRQFLRGTSSGLGLLAASSALPRWLVGEAQAATLNGYAGYRAIVSVFLLGGNDANNILVPLGATPYAHYRAARPNIGIPQADLLPISPTGLGTNSYGLHPALKKVQALFGQQRAALVCNVGSLVVPLRKPDYGSGATPLPDNLYSHSDQQDAWASAIANPATAPVPFELVGKATGWGGRTADKLQGLNPSRPRYPDVVSFGGKPLFAAGAVRQPMMVSSSGTLAFRQTSDANFNALQTEALSQVMTHTHGVTLEASYGGIFTQAQTFATSRAAARDAAWAALPVATQTAIDALFVPPAGATNWTLLTQLYQVLRDILAGATATGQGGLGLRRQAFSVGLGGFDTHVGQLPMQNSLLTQLDFALDAFYQALDVLRSSGVFGATPPQATLFTMSDFSRTMVENSDRGTDHAWGGHAIVIGDRVQGGRFYGTYPNLDLSANGVNNLDTTDSRGRWIPTLSVDQYAYSLAYWLGLSTAAEREYVFPNLAGYITAATAGGFPSSARNNRVGFMLADT